MVPVLSASWSRRTLGLTALALAIVFAVTLCLRLAHIGAPGAPWPLIILASAAWGALISTLYTLRAKYRQAHQPR
jgi:hypothetical protein